MREHPPGPPLHLLGPPGLHRFPGPPFNPGEMPPLFLPPMGMCPPDKPVFPGLVDPRPLYMQWAAHQGGPMPNPFIQGMGGPNPAYLQVIIYLLKQGAFSG